MTKEMKKAIKEIIRHQEELMKYLLNKCNEEKEVRLVKRLIGDYAILQCYLEENKEEVGEEEEMDLEKVMVDYLWKLRIPTRNKGYEYIKTAILMCYENRELINMVTKGLYVDIAKKFDTKSSRVERAIRHAIEVAWNKGSEEWQEIFGYPVEGHKKPTNSEFIAKMVEYIRFFYA